jgi:hypothetical protein
MARYLTHKYSFTKFVYYLSVRNDSYGRKLRLALPDFDGRVHHPIFRNEHYFLKGGSVPVFG